MLFKVDCLILYTYVFFYFFFFLMIRRPPRSTLFPYRRSSDLGDHAGPAGHFLERLDLAEHRRFARSRDRKSTRLNSSHVEISYAVFCLKKKKDNTHFVDSSY